MKTSTKLEEPTRQPSIIRFRDDQYQLTMDELREQTGHKAGLPLTWCPASLQFISYQDGMLHLRNTCKQESYLLSLTMKPEGLQVTCDCSDNSKPYCDHIYGALQTLIGTLGESYFKKLLPEGAIQLAFKHRLCFDKMESSAGLDVSVREELQTVFWLDNLIVVTDLSAMLNLPADGPKSAKPFIAQEDKKPGEDGICYLWIVPYRNRFQPFVLPCAGKMNKAQTEVKQFYGFLSALQQPYDSLLTEAQQELNKTCFAHWQLAETLPGRLIKEGLVQCQTHPWFEILNYWRSLIEQLSQQAFVYAYFLHRVDQLKKDKPHKQRATGIFVSTDVPVVTFSLTDMGVYYQFRPEIWINRERVQEYEADTSFFVTHKNTLYLLGSLRDAAILQWMDQLEGVITVFKEHFAAFEQTILAPIRQHYTVTTNKTN